MVPVYTAGMQVVGNVQLVAGNTRTLKELFEFLKSNGIEPQGNPDVYVREYAAFGVDEARELSQRASSRAIASPRRIFVIVTPGMTGEAQNALLKTFEEPSGDAIFFIIVPSPYTLLPTLRSRAQLLKLSSSEAVSSIDIQEFLEAKPQARLDMLKPLLDKDEDDKRDTSGAIVFLSALEQQLAVNPKTNEEGLRAVYRARSYVGDKGSLIKALLEQVALLI